jgi:hypothetical protein
VWQEVASVSVMVPSTITMMDVLSPFTIAGCGVVAIARISGCRPQKRWQYRRKAVAAAAAESQEGPERVPVIVYSARAVAVASR